LKKKLNQMLTRELSRLSKNDIAVAGGKGASLGELTKAKFPVPSGFVVLAEAFKRFLAETDLNVEVEAILGKVNHQDINSVDKASNEIRDLIADAEFPPDIGEEVKKEFKRLGAQFVAVRSSATAEDSAVASWAGELESYLNVDEAGLLEAVKKCWSSLFTPRAIFYRFEKKLHKQPVAVAVVVQTMIQSEISGIVFTVHPVTEDKDQMVIEAGYGLGEAIVGGKITPDTYIINKLTLRPALRRRLWRGEQAQGIIAEAIMDKNISSQKIKIVRQGSGVVEVEVEAGERDKQKLTDEKILELADTCVKIEKHYNSPQDIEWAFAEDKVYIVQSRPITTLR